MLVKRFFFSISNGALRLRLMTPYQCGLRGLQNLKVGGVGLGAGASLVQQQICPQFGHVQESRQEGMPRGGVWVCESSS